MLKTLISFGVSVLMSSKLDRLKRIPVLTWAILLLVVAWIPIPFVGFHPYHDGLMLATILQQKQALLTGGAYPFNQYGSFWSFPFLLPSLVTPDEYILLVSRIITVFMYTIAAIFIWKTAQMVRNRSTAYLTVFLLLLSHPYGLEPIPWPSSTQLFLLSAISYCSALLFINEQNDTKSKARLSRFAITIGILTGMSIFTRVQVGILLCFFFIIFLFMIREFRLLKGYVFGLFTFVLIWLLVMFSFGWLRDSIIDEFQFVFAIVGHESTDKPFPIWTIVLSFLLLILYSTVALLSKNSNSIRVSDLIPKIFFFVSVILFLVIFSLFYLKLETFPAKLEFYANKFWVSFLLSFTILFVFQARAIIYRVAMRRRISSSEQTTLVFTCLSVISEFQIYPLFDPMHSWWSSVPTVILIAIAIDKTFNQFPFFIIFKSRIFSLVLSISLVFILLAPYGIALSKPSVPLLPQGIFGIHVDKRYADTENKTQVFFRKYISSTETTLNLCRDANPFFTADFKSASRYFIYWTNMNDFNPAQSNILNSRPDRIVYCQQAGTELDPGISKIISSLMPNKNELGRLDIDSSQKIVILGD
jgi:hypothetical protein